MGFNITEDNVLYLYEYYSYGNKEDLTSKAVYHVFKKGWMNYYGSIKNDMIEALSDYISKVTTQKSNVAIVIMPSHSEGMYGEGLLKLARDLSRELGLIDESHLIQRTITKTKSTDGGARNIYAHLATMGISAPIDNSVDLYIILDDITTTGSSLEAARQLLISNGVTPNKIVKIAAAKTTHDF